MVYDFKGFRVLVLGGAGFIGRSLCQLLLDNGAAVRCLDRGKPQGDQYLEDLKNEMEWVSADFSDEQKIREAVEGMDYIFHLISTTIPASSNQDLLFDLTSNVVPTLKLLDIAKDAKIKKLIFISSGGTIYGIPHSVPIPENHQTNPLCGYGIHKLAIEKYLSLYYYNFNLNYSILRLSNPYGYAQISDRPQGVIGKFIYQALRNKPLEIWGDGSVVRDYIYIDDILDAFLRAMLYEGKEKVFNVASGIGHSLTDIISYIEGAAGYPLNVSFSSSRHVDVPLNVLDISRIKTELGWCPETDMATGIGKLFEYSRQLKNLK
ncbi:SDR family NAD(P)-dependent oxidoreductase [Spirochaeta isovalerica]|uniref:UDP-glucose 4-epimerase n=1 Tax=Spirochaeta isovalerica TaxID=150 RepID=A0A841R7S5_9SPIO|nr:SDR family NAD(P)-dependent oxidoreductase [Spirochaeta isovalerica]MBB6479247.1 UDP-glucose 4-epimerase [Spirochaeta isovalerica]